MSISPTVAAVALAILGALGADPTEAASYGSSTFDKTPGFLKRAEVALERGRYDRVVGLIVPRLGRLHRSEDRHFAYATLCGAQLNLENFSMAAESCSLAAQSEHANWSDLNNLGVYHYAMGEFDRALEWFERAETMGPQRKAVRVNIEAAVAAVAER